MADHVAPWEDEKGWTHSNCPNGYNFPDVVCHLSRYLGYPQCPKYIAKMVTENEDQVHQVFIYLTPHPDRVHMFQEMNPTLREAYEAVALAALTELCERHAADLDVALVSYLPIHHQADGPWRVQHQRMLETSDFGRSVTKAQLATTADYALNLFNLQQVQRLEVHHLKQQVGQLQVANTALTEQVEAAQDQNADLQITMAELNNQLQHILINDGINMQLEVNAVEEEEEELTEIQGESSIASGFIDEPRHVDGARIVPANELSDEESSVNQPVPVAPVAHDLIIFPVEMYAQVTEAAHRYGVEIDRMFAFYPPPRQ